MKSNNKKFFVGFWVVLLTVFLASAFYIGYRSYKLSESDPIVIAVAGPFSGQNSAVGKSISQAVSLYFDKVNKSGGIKGKPLHYVFFDDNDDISKAVSCAQKIANRSDVYVVIGHDYSDCSTQAGAIYKQYKIPAITPTSTNYKVTLDNNWYFRAIFDDTYQGTFIANYAAKLLNQKKVSIICDNSDYGTTLAEVFEKNVNRLGLSILFRYSINAQDASIEKIVKNLSDIDKQNEGMIFLAIHSSIGIELIKQIRDAGIKSLIIGGDSFSSDQFKDMIHALPKEKLTPGFYTDNLYVSTPFMPNVSNNLTYSFMKDYKSEFDQEPDWIAVYSWDTAKIVHEAIQIAQINWKKDSIARKREKIRRALLKFNNLTDSIKGVSGYYYFDQTRSVPKPLVMGMFKNSKLYPAEIQLQPIRNINDMSALDQEIKNKTIIESEQTGETVGAENFLPLQDRSLFVETLNATSLQKYLYQTQVVYSGIKINEISEIDIDKGTCNLDFSIWFRFKDDIAPQNIVFENAVTPIELNRPKKEIRSKNELIYLSYQVLGRFFIDYVPGDNIFDHHSVGVRFHHKDKTSNNLLYVQDYEKRITDSLSFDEILNPVTGWTIKTMEAYPEIIVKSALGNPTYLGSEHGKIEYSGYDYKVTIKKTNFTLRGLIPFDTSVLVIMISVIFLILFELSIEKLSFTFFSPAIWLLELLMSLSLLLSVEVVILKLFSSKLDKFHIEFIRTVFDILWWMIPAFFINLAIRRLVLIPMTSKTQMKVPNILPRSIGFVVYMLALGGIVAFVFNQEITKLLATGGVFAMIIGLAVKMNIADVISGIAINLEAPFRLGDWVQIGGYEGKVVDITWRSTRIKTGENSIVSIPNSKATDSEIHNYNFSDDLNRINLQVKIDYGVKPERVKKILSDALLSRKEIPHNPPHSVEFTGIDQDSANFEISFATKDYANKNILTDLVWERLWMHLYYAGTCPAGNNSYAFKTRPSVYDIFRQLDVFTQFDNAEIEQIGNIAKERVYLPEQIIINQGDTGQSFFIIQEGAVSVSVHISDENQDESTDKADKADKSDKSDKSDKNNTSEIVEVDTMGVGDYFGEMPFLSETTRTATVRALTTTNVYTLTKKDLLPIIEKHPNFIDTIEQIHKSRTFHRESQKQIHQDSTVKKSIFKRWVLKLFKKGKKYDGA